MPAVETRLGQLWDRRARRLPCALHGEVLLARRDGGAASLRRRPGRKRRRGATESRLPWSGLPPRRRTRALPVRILLACEREGDERAGRHAVRARDRDGVGRAGVGGRAPLTLVGRVRRGALPTRPYGLRVALPACPRAGSDQ